MKIEEITALIAAQKCSEVGNSLKGDIVRLMMKIYTSQGKLKEVNIEILRRALALQQKMAARLRSDINAAKGMGSSDPLGLGL